MAVIPEVLSAHYAHAPRPVCLQSAERQVGAQFGITEVAVCREMWHDQKIQTSTLPAAPRANFEHFPEYIQPILRLRQSLSLQRKHLGKGVMRMSSQALECNLLTGFARLCERGSAAQ
jgi:hypothetical protein